jgi:hypothetical protein
MPSWRLPQPIGVRIIAGNGISLVGLPRGGVGRREDKRQRSLATLTIWHGSKVLRHGRP